MKIGKKTKISIIIVIFIVFFYFILCLIFPLPLEKIEGDYSTVHVVAKTGELLRITLSASGKYRIKANLGEISDYVKKGFIYYEDRTFYFNPGVNPVAIVRAAFLNAKNGRIVSGGSTITMQVAKMIEPKPRTYLSKIIELFRVSQINLKYSKNQIFEI
ncbi:MAG TPA: transglycosylase domain-containing protein, partial [Candidatus Goldiibacteriota bacterium]|nr:transglycosylase domain-containing protein [Candidatus Goldiibacteriota bacterium]